MLEKVLKATLVLLYIPVCFLWNLKAIGYILPLWVPSLGPGTSEWVQAADYVPLGCLMLIGWLVSLMFLLLGFSKKNRDNGKSRRRYR